MTTTNTKQRDTGYQPEKAVGEVASYTPGPWEVHQGYDYLCILRPDDTTDYAIHVPDGDVADARLIAAAPELFERLEELLEYSEHLKGSEVYARAERAIAKAKGDA